MGIPPVAPLLPRERLLAVYWIPAVGISNPPKQPPGEQWVTVPLGEILAQPRVHGRPTSGVVFLGFAHFVRNGGLVTLEIREDLMRQLQVQPGESVSHVQRLQLQGIKVLLSVQGHKRGMGWDDLLPHERAPFAKYVKSDIIDLYGLDGIDIDDEQNIKFSAQSFVDTVAVLRYYLQGSLISRALYDDIRYFTIPVSSGSPHYSGAYLSSLLDFGCTMAYTDPAKKRIATIASYHDLKGHDGQNVGLRWDQLCIGVMAGPPHYRTPIADASWLAAWAAEPLSDAKKIPPILGMMLFSFSQDILQFTHDPQNTIMYPNPNDHQWQKAIVAGMWGTPPHES